MKLHYYGHSACLLECGTHRVLIDPFLKGNPLASILPDQVKCDYILLTHGHNDHVGDTVEIAKANDATVVAVYELAHYLQAQGCKVHPLGTGGRAAFPFGYVKLTPAVHSSSYTDEAGVVHHTGSATGLLISMEHQTVYHAGDTALFGDMKLMGEMNKIDLAMLPIGDNFTMGVHDAAEAVGMLRPKHVVPMHYNTWPPIEVDPQKFAEKVDELGVDCHVMAPGDTLDF